MNETPLFRNFKIDAANGVDPGRTAQPELSERRFERHSNKSQPNNTDGAAVETKDEEASRQKLQVLLAGLWDRSRHTVVERIEILEMAQSLAIHSSLDEPARLRAVDSAHKLAGVLGTFGLPRGSELAREAEEVFGQQSAMSPAQIERLGALIEDLARMVRTAGPYPAADSR